MRSSDLSSPPSPRLWVRRLDSAKRLAGHAVLAGLVLLGASACGETGFTHGETEPLAVVERALESSATGDDHTAFALLSSGVEEFPGSFELRREYAAAAARTERLALAIDAFESLLAAEPDNRDVARQLAWTSLSGGFLEHATAPVAALTARDDASAFDLELASRLAFERGELEAAADWAQRATGLDPADAQSAYQLARVLVALEDPGARAALERTLELDPGQAQARFALGTLELQAGDTAAGERQLALRVKLRSLAGKKYKALPAKQRIARAQALAKALPTWSRPALEIARAQLELGQPKKAQATLERAADLHPEHLDRLELNYAAALARGQQQAADKWLAAWKAQRHRPQE